MDNKQQLQALVESLEEVSSCEDLDEDKKARLVFLTEQLKLINCSAKKYSCDTLLWAFQVYASGSRSYRLLRQSFLTLPHPSYLKKLSSVFNIGSGIKDASVHEEYLNQKCKNMSEGERNVNLMIDEIHVAHHLSYKEGKLEGSASNCSVSEASTAQVFMISSLLSKNKDVAAIVPVKNINARMLYDMIVKVLKMLHTIGYIVTCIISDNNRVNRNAFTLMCGGKLQASIENPNVPTEKLFFLFDTVHLFKCIRNNWLAQKDVEKTFMFPSLEPFNGPPLKAMFSHLRKLYSEEKSSTVKLAPSLTHKCLNPTNLEKQNVSLMLKIFDQRNILALEHFEKTWQTDTSGTRQFIAMIVKLWNIINVKHPFKGARIRNEDCKTITSPSDEKLQYMQKVISWLKGWQGLQQRPREGVLSTETMTALEHTLSALIELSIYLLQVKQFKYVLLGKFQTDNLEMRFSQYRRMSGCNFHVSVQQLLEGEKKLKLMSVLRMISASNGALRLKQITEPLEEVKSDRSLSLQETELVSFLPRLADCDSIEVSDEQLKALVFVSGYCVSKVVRQTECEACKRELKEDRRLLVETTEDSHTYLSALDRGGLTWPSDYAVQIVTEVFKVFQLLIGNEKHEQEFLCSSNQRKLVTSLALRRLAELDMFQQSCEECHVSCEEVVTKCCRPAINIFLNNYSKAFTDKAFASSKARKLKTFTKRA